MADAIQKPTRKIDLLAPELSLAVELLLTEARAEGYDFVEGLWEDWAAGTNRFDGQGETFSGYFDQGHLVAVGGVNLDHYAQQSHIGRIRRVYVRPAWRNQGIGRKLVAALVEEARKHFACVRLRAENADAARLYERMGFSPIVDPGATHILHFPAW